MKAVVFGALLSQGLNAQVLGPAAAPLQGANIPVPNVPVTDQFPAVPAPLIIPGPNAPSEADLLSSVANAAVGSLGVGLGASAGFSASAGVAGGAAPSVSSSPTPSSAPPLPVGTADVILGSSSNAPFGGTTTPGAGVGFIGSVLNIPGALATPSGAIGAANAAINNINSGAAAAISNINSGAANAASAIASAVNGLASPVVSGVASAASSGVANVNSGLGAIIIPPGPTGSVPSLAAPVIPIPVLPIPTNSRPAIVPLGVPPVFATPSSTRPALFGLPNAVASVASNALNAVGQGLGLGLGASAVSRITSTTSRSPTPTSIARNSFGLGLDLEASASARVGFGILAADEPTLVDTPMSATEDPNLATDAPLPADDMTTSSDVPGPSQLAAPDASPLAANPASNGLGSLAAGLGGNWNADDNNYDGQDYGDEDQYNGGDYEDDSKPSKGYPDDDEDDEPCPSYCQKAYPHDDSGYKSKPSPPSYDSGSDYQPKRPGYSGYSRRALRSRLEPASGGFAAFNWPSSSDDSGDAEDDDIPDWLYQSAGKQKPDAKPKCPLSCYKPQKPQKPYRPYPPYPPKKPTDGYQPEDPYTEATPTPRYPPSYGGRPSRPYGTGKPYRPYPSGGVKINSTAWESPIWSKTESWVSKTSEAVTTETSEGTTTEPSEGTTTEPSEGTTTADAWNSTSTITATTLATVTLPKPDAPFSSVYAGDQTWTGDTLAGVCPKTCDPIHPDQNFCDITSSCATAGGSKYYCACRAGYMASAWNPKDFSKQFHVPGQPYVYVAPGVVCDKVCDDQSCSQVMERPKCV